MTLETLLLPYAGTALLVFARIAGLLLPLPLFGPGRAPRSVRFAAAVLLTLIALTTLGSPADVPSSAAALVGTMALEFMIGWGAGTLIALLFAALAMLGDLVQRLGGFSVAAAFDPTFGESVPALTPFLTTLGVVVFLLAGGLDALAAGLLDSFVRLAPGTVPNVEHAVTLLTETLNTATALALRTATPCAVASLTVWLTAGLLGRFTLGASAMALGFSANMLLALSILNLSLAGILFAFAGEIPAAFRTFTSYFTSAGG